MPVSSTSGSLQVQANLTCANNQTPLALSPSTNPSAFSKKLSFVLGGNLALGINQLCSILSTPAASGNVTLDMTSVTNVLGQAAITLSRLKAILIQLLSTTDDATNGTACSSITIDNTVTNALSAQSHSGWFDNAAEGAANGSKFAIPNGGFLAFGTPAAAGVLVDGTHKIIKLVNNDGGNAAGILTSLWGADA